MVFVLLRLVQVVGDLKSSPWGFGKLLGVHAPSYSLAPLLLVAVPGDEVVRPREGVFGTFGELIPGRHLVAIELSPLHFLVPPVPTGFGLFVIVIQPQGRLEAEMSAVVSLVRHGLPPKNAAALGRV